jgi:signal transduction histidine kinase
LHIKAAMNNTGIENDIEAVSKISAVSSILEVICRTTGMGFAAVARVTEEKWVTCAVRDEINFGLVPGSELELETTICHEIRQSQTPVIINEVCEDPGFKDHHTPAMYGFQSYISFPIILKNGKMFGTLCAIDPKPAALNTPEVKAMFELFAELISFHLLAVDELSLTEVKLEEERKTAEFRDQFIAILGHDLRNPVGAVLNAAQLLLRMPLEDRARRLSTIVLDSAHRAKELINNILDFASGHLGQGIQLSNTSDSPVEQLLTQVITEMTIVAPTSIFEVKMEINQPVYCDGVRIAQLFSNLLGNAIIHGKKELPIKIQAKCEEGSFILSVANGGDKIPDQIMARLFQPFSHGKEESHKQGLGLGLFIAHEIALAHKGEILVSSTDEETRFTLRIPLPTV